MHTHNTYKRTTHTHRASINWSVEAVIMIHTVNKLG